MGDYSDNYTASKKAYIFFGYQSTIISFKPFLEDLSYEIEKNSSDNKDAIYNAINKETTFKSAKFNIGFNVLASNIKEAIENHKKFQLLIRMNTPKLSSHSIPKMMHVKFSNLIGSDSSGGFNSANQALMLEKGFKCTITSVKYEPIMELGFFEHKGMIYAKAFKISTELRSAMPDYISKVPAYHSGFNYGSSGDGVSTTNTTRQAADPVITTVTPFTPPATSGPGGMSTQPSFTESLLTPQSGISLQLESDTNLSAIGQNIIPPPAPRGPLPVPSTNKSDRAEKTTPLTNRRR